MYHMIVHKKEWYQDNLKYVETIKNKDKLNMMKDTFVVGCSYMHDANIICQTIRLPIYNHFDT